MTNPNEIIDVDLDFMGVTEAAYKFEDHNETTVYLPKSLVDGMYPEEPNLGQHCVVGIPYWLAEEKGLV